MADGELTDGEADFVNTLVLRLDLNGEQVEQIAEVMAMKNAV